MLPGDAVPEADEDAAPAWRALSNPASLSGGMPVGGRVMRIDVDIFSLMTVRCVRCFCVVCD
jgi:hypothetical protein